jgi:lysophospholipase L1-like esterase
MHWRFLFMRYLVHAFIFFTTLHAEPIKVALAGDSTVATVQNPPKERPDLAGWGQMLGEFMPKATVVNHARSGWCA